MKFISHNNLFAFGFFYYLIIPLFVVNIPFSDNLLTLNLWKNDFSLLSQETIIYYLFTITIYAIFFYLGSFLVFKKKKYTITKKTYISINYISIVVSAFLLYLIAEIIGGRVSISSNFSEYTESYNAKFIGQVATLTIISLFVALHGILTKNINNFFWLNVICLFALILMLILLGVRMYALIPILSLVIYKKNYAPIKIKTRRLFLYVLLVAFFMGVLGLLRTGTSVSAELIFYNLIAESTFTWWSNLIYLSEGNAEGNYFGNPKIFLSSIYNFIPSIVFPNKSDFIYSHYDVYSFSRTPPLGATSIFTSINASFGLIGGAFYTFFLGCYFSFIRLLSIRSSFFKTYYIIIVSMIGFQLFRDAFPIVNKLLYFNALAVPALLFFVSKILLKLKILRKKNNESSIR